MKARAAPGHTPTTARLLEDFAPSTRTPHSQPSSRQSRKLSRLPSPLNPQNWDIIQVISPGGTIGYYVDYQGVAHGS